MYQLTAAPLLFFLFSADPHEPCARPAPDLISRAGR